jgi:type I restriction enzyme M protein
VEFEPDPDLRDTEQIPFSEAPDSGLPGGLPTEDTAKAGIEAFFRREVLPYTPDAWIKPDSAKVGYEISFTRHFYKPQPLRTLAEIRADILAVQQESEGLLDSILKGAQP